MPPGRWEFLGLRCLPEHSKRLISLASWESRTHAGYPSLPVSPTPLRLLPSAGEYLPLLGSPFCLQGASAALHTLGEAEVAVVGTVVQVSQPCQGQDVVTGNSQDGQFGQLLPIGVARHLRMQGEGMRTAAGASVRSITPPHPPQLAGRQGSGGSLSSVCLDTPDFTTSAN